MSRGYDRELAVLARIAAEPSRPLLLSGGVVLTGDATLGDWAVADVLLGGNRVVGIGPGLVGAAEDDGMIVIDCHGCIVMPAERGKRLVPAEAADVAVYRLADPNGEPNAPAENRASHLDILLREGKPIIWNGVSIAASVDGSQRAGMVLTEVQPDDPRLGMWSDGFLRQHLLPNGRYDEGRGERDSAYQGRFWIDGDRIDYLDDEGFWAFGTFEGDLLEHAGYRLARVSA